MLRSIDDFFPEGTKMASPAGLYLDPASIIGLTVLDDPPRLVVSMPANIIEVRLPAATDPAEVARTIVAAAQENTMGEVAAMREHCAQLAERVVGDRTTAAMIRKEPRGSEKYLVTCDCTIADKCPQGRADIETRCEIWKR